jgi:hypothetical protein
MVVSSFLFISLFMYVSGIVLWVFGFVLEEDSGFFGEEDEYSYVYEFLLILNSEMVKF